MCWCGIKCNNKKVKDKIHVSFWFHIRQKPPISNNVEDIDTFKPFGTGSNPAHILVNLIKEYFKFQDQPAVCIIYRLKMKRSLNMAVVRLDPGKSFNLAAVCYYSSLKVETPRIRGKPGKISQMSSVRTFAEVLLSIPVLCKIFMRQHDYKVL